MENSWPGGYALEHRSNQIKQNTSVSRRYLTIIPKEEPEASGAHHRNSNEIELAQTENQQNQQNVARQNNLDRAVEHSGWVSYMDSRATTRSSSSLQAQCMQLERLTQERATHVHMIKGFEDKITEGQILYGRLMQEWLKISRAMGLKKEHIAEDREHLAKEQRLANDTDQKIDLVLADIQRLVLESERSVVDR